MATFESELTALINRYSRENESDTPDYILADFMLASLRAFNGATNARDNWHGFKPFGMAPAPALSEDARQE